MEVEDGIQRRGGLCWRALSLARAAGLAGRGLREGLVHGRGQREQDSSPEGQRSFFSPFLTVLSHRKGAEALVVIGCLAAAEAFLHIIRIAIAQQVRSQGILC